MLLTGGDPLVMRTDLLASYLEPLLEPGREHVETIRIGTKALSFWPYRLLAGPEADSLLRLLERLTAAGKHVAMMLHLSHAAELKTDAVAGGAVPAGVDRRRVAGPGPGGAARERRPAHLGRPVAGRGPQLASCPTTCSSNGTPAHGRYYGLPLARAVGHLSRCAATGFGSRADRAGSGDVRDARQGRHRRRRRSGLWARVRAAHAAGTPARAGRQAVLRRL